MTSPGTRLLVAICFALPLAGRADEPLQAFKPDANTLLLYHFDETDGAVARDASGRHPDARILGARPVRGRFGGGLWFDGTDDSVFLERPDALRGLKALTVECWFKQDYTSGRRFLVGHDVGFHFEVDDAGALSISLYNEGGRTPNADGEPHRQVAVGGIGVRPGRWHHLAITYDGGTVSYFLDGVLRQRRPGPADFALGAESRGLWIGCYVGMDFWYSGTIDEVRVSDCVRYDKEGAMAVGDRMFEMDTGGKPLRAAPAVRVPRSADRATVEVALRKEPGGDADGWVFLKPPRGPAVVVGEYAVRGAPGSETDLTVDVSDEAEGPGTYLLGLVPRTPGVFEASSARLRVAGRLAAEWSGTARSRVTFRPPVLIPLVWPAPGADPPAGPLLLLPGDVDRVEGTPEIDQPDPDLPPVISGDGRVEWWFHTATPTTHRVYLRYAAASPRPCDLVIDGRDLNEFDMCALNSTGQASPRDAFWEYQGSVTLQPGAHWLRLQDVLPDTVAVLLEPVPTAPPAEVPAGRFPVPPAGPFASAASDWTVTPVLGAVRGAVTDTEVDGAPALRFEAEFGNHDPARALGADVVRFSRGVRLDLEPVGCIAFALTGTGNGHVVAVGLTDAKGDEKLLWRLRDAEPGRTAVDITPNFEGNDVFDPGRVVALWVDMDEGNHLPEQPGSMHATLSGLQFTLRGELAEPEGYPARLAAARERAARLSAAGPAAGTLQAPRVRPYLREVVPEEHPRFAATDPRPVTRAAMGSSLHFTGARSIDPSTLADFHTHYDFGDVCWPHIGILPQKANFPDPEDYRRALAELEARLTAVRDRGLYLFDIWGYVPNGEAGPTPRVEPEHHEILLRLFGDRFTGYDNGEQDGRYIGGYADRGPHTNRREGWEDFVRWDEGICNDSMNYMNATGSLNFSHYYGERGARMLGLETAQGLPSDTLLFAFLRGAAKEYGRLTYQATSIWNRFGYNLYNDRKTTGGNGYGFGPNKGCSLSLHRRLLFQSYTGGDVIVGTETGQFTADRNADGAPELSPLGAQHLRIREWVDAHPDRGVLITPVAFMLDFHHGWNMPRHLYRGDRYKIWGKLPYAKSDYAVDAFFRLVWPGYEDASYLRNERGFITDTPYGDIFDVVTHRCPPEILDRYAAVILPGEVEITPEAAAALAGFVRRGGDLLLDARAAARLPPDLVGCTPGEAATAVMTLRPDGSDARTEPPYTYARLALDGAVPVLVSETGDAILALNRAGSGRVLVCAADCWLTDALAYAHPERINMEPPYRLLDGVTAVLDGYLRGFSPVAASPDRVNLRVNGFADDPERLLVAITNNDLFAPWVGTLSLREGAVAAVRGLRGGPEPTVRDGSVRLTVPKGDVAIVEIRRALPAAAGD